MFRERYAEIGYAENELYDGIDASIRVMHERGERLGVCTAKRVDFAERIIAMFDLADCFAFIDGGEIGRGKTEQLANLIRDQHIDADALMIGDRKYDIEAAREQPGDRGLTGAWNAEIGTVRDRHLLAGISHLKASKLSNET